MNEPKMSAKQILNKGYVRRLAPDESGGFVASILEFPGCVAEGETADEALTNLDSAAEVWIEAALSSGYHIREPIDFDGYSGKVALRMPRSLHRQAAELAELEGSSLNQLLVTAIAHYVGGKQLFNKLQTFVQPVRAYHIQNVQIMQQNTITSWQGDRFSSLNSLAFCAHAATNYMTVPSLTLEHNNG